MGLIPRDRWIEFSHQLIHHGRRVCNSRKPKCEACVLSDVCPYGRGFLNDAGNS
jgi:endonuclease-3